MRLTPEEMSVQDARSQGQKAGEMSYGASMNPYSDGTPENAIWENARTANISYRLNSLVKLAGETC